MIVNGSIRKKDDIGRFFLLRCLFGEYIAGRPDRRAEQQDTKTQAFLAETCLQRLGGRAFPGPSPHGHWPDVTVPYGNRELRTPAHLR